MALWMAAPNANPRDMLTKAAELRGRTDLTDQTGRLGIRVFPSIEDAADSYERA